MKLILINILIANIYLVFSKKINTKKDSCMDECHKLKSIWNCYCDPICVDFNDCCNLYMRGCQDFFDSQTSFPHRNRTNISKNVKGSCCQSDSNLDCFCDSKCETNGDCCLDHKTCKSLRMNGFNHNDEKRSNMNNFDKNHLLPYLKKDVLTPQLYTVYFKRSPLSYD
jgi:hypothetical protein